MCEYVNGKCIRCPITDPNVFFTWMAGMSSKPIRDDHSKPRSNWITTYNNPTSVIKAYSAGQLTIENAKMNLIAMGHNSTLILYDDIIQPTKHMGMIKATEDLYNEAMNRSQYGLRPEW